MANSEPIGILRFTLSPKRELYSYKVVVRHEPGVITRICTIPELKKVDVQHLTYAPISFKKRGRVSLFLVADFCGSGVDPEALLEKLKRTKGVIDAELDKEIFPGLIIDDFHFPIYLMKDYRAIIVGQGMLSGLLEGIRDEMGPAGEAFLYHQGFEAGKMVVDYWLPMVQSIVGIRTKRELWDAMSKVIKALGWASIETLNWSDDGIGIRIRADGLVECQLLKRHMGSHMFRGFISGILSRLFGKELLAKEVKCISKGDEYCEFLTTEVFVGER
ncbi:MAG: hypothetical protein DRN05_06635 [Thermoplasmata archaeon]|nr:MAG: hypothetical protein DRN05_06635 [Thermoplasmata archaeon]